LQLSGTSTHGGNLAIFQITRSGLTAIAVLVLILWGCLVTERQLLKQSRMDAYRAMRDMRYLKLRRQIEPASAPARLPSAPKSIQAS
jgi:hypothetical protein